ncbi:MAG TPA: isoprenylcysteine carboxylmethyltransferase family protein [Candidatus Omnitrophica bacterium]|nr:isoprenylcysteine carboxylmethyltransferase family protein [Candidatus Omnitrophota bacterium]
MDIKERFIRWFKLRFAILYPFGVLAVLFGNSDDDSIMAGIWFIIVGLLIRLWANGYAVKMEKLTVSGPYAFVRHPLYLGTMFLMVGFIIMLRFYYIGIFFISVMSIVYYKTIKKEEMWLEDIFKQKYRNYKRNVPAILPRIMPYRGSEKWPFSFKRLMRSKEYKVLFWMVIVIIAFHLKGEFVIEHETMDAKMWTLVIVAFILGILDLWGEFLRQRNKRIKTNVVT